MSPGLTALAGIVAPRDVHVPQECVDVTDATLSRVLTCSAPCFAALGFEDAPNYDRMRQMLVAGIVDAVAFDWEVRFVLHEALKWFLI